MADYLLEALGPERFQKLCQALLAAEFPSLQCLPVAQPDGGRDAFTPLEAPRPDATLVFQVKFARRPETVKDPISWLDTTISRELPKIVRLVNRGAEQYMLLTNLMGTAHLDVGTIDRMNRLLQEKIPIPAQCWWRDDIARRLDNNSSLKWSYVELIHPGEILQMLLESGLSEDRRRRATAIRAFLQAQYHEEITVRFRQIDLRNDLFDLFIDVPAAMKHYDPETKETARDAIQVQKIASEIDIQRFEGIYYQPTPEYELQEGRQVPRVRRVGVGAAALFLHTLAQSTLPRVVLEGAPGQGKSTLAQYICQVHRIRLLGLNSELRAIPEAFRKSALRLPIRIDLKDMAAAIQDKQLPDGTEFRDKSSPISLEEFIAALIRKRSGGISFTVADLHFVVADGPVLLLLDGLDEVADIDLRRDIVSEVTQAVQRLDTASASLQVIITSRPAAFANSPGFSEEYFRYFSLISIGKRLVADYAQRWSRAKGLTVEEQIHVMNVLDSKLGQPHMRELARNPMQLAILLSLINTLGSSLPDMRTALYDEYIKLFINREVEKDKTILRYRQLIIDIHRYLGWHLHSNAEKGNSRGSIPKAELMDTLRSYLSREQRDPALVDELFQGVTERVMALVQRVEGIYEFEVQPLREYFCAKYLYVTAPYSPVGRKRKGTKPDRFDAIARNPYWLNVTRFYAGCYSQGELPDLADRLEALWQEPDFASTSHPRVLTTMLLQDWVFEQNPRATTRVVNLIATDLGRRHTLRIESSPTEHAEAVALAEECGREQLLRRCFEALRSGLPMDRAIDLCNLARLNSSTNELQRKWYEQLIESQARERTTWLMYGQYLDVIRATPPSDIARAMSDGIDLGRRMTILIRGGAVKYYEADSTRAQDAIDRVLRDYVGVTVHPARADSPVQALASYLDGVVRIPPPILHRDASLEQAMRQYIWAGGTDRQSSLRHEDLTSSSVRPEVQKCAEVVRVWEEQFDRPCVEWLQSLSPWDRAIGATTKYWGERWACIRAACTAAGITSRTERGMEFSSFDDTSVSLVQRARYARLRAGSPRWWERMLNGSLDPQYQAFGLCLLLGWGSLRTIQDLEASITPLIEPLNDSQLMAIQRVVQVISRARGQEGVHLHLSNRVNPNLVMLLISRLSKESARKAYETYVSKAAMNNICLLDLRDKMELPEKIRNQSEAVRALAVVRRSHDRGHLIPGSEFRRRVSTQVLASVSRRILSAPESYPLLLVDAAESAGRALLSGRITPVVDIARREGWFE